MAFALLGKKIGMTRMYDEKGVVMPVTVIQAGPCTVVQVKNEQGDGYNALKIGFNDIKPKKSKKAQIEEAKKANIPLKAIFREFKLDKPSDKSVGDEITVAEFEEIKYVDVTGTSKGRGFAGAMKRHGFKGLGASHGVERKHRSLGSIGGSAGNAGGSRGVRKGKKMPGHYGHATCTTRNHPVISIDIENNLIIVKGPVAGANNGLLMVSKAKTKN
ncbi:MAG: 50S ribosomal protein L3 [Planctomycetes bacterium]|nr:50S ribosomal protein L3 [Planctomycetota bacterium]